jgi:hypothetical protein
VSGIEHRCRNYRLTEAKGPALENRRAGHRNGGADDRGAARRVGPRGDVGLADGGQR